MQIGAGSKVKFQLGSSIISYELVLQVANLRLIQITHGKALAMFHIRVSYLSIIDFVQP